MVEAELHQSRLDRVCRRLLRGHGGLDWHERLVMMVLVDLLDGRWECSIGQVELARRCRVSRQTVNRIVGRLVSDRWLRTKRVGGRSLPIVYRVRVEWICPGIEFWKPGDVRDP